MKVQFTNQLAAAIPAAKPIALGKRLPCLILIEMVVLNRTVFLLNFRCYGKSNQTKPHPSQVRQVL